MSVGEGSEPEGEGYLPPYPSEISPLRGRADEHLGVPSRACGHSRPHGGECSHSVLGPRTVREFPQLSVPDYASFSACDQHWVGPMLR